MSNEIKIQPIGGRSILRLWRLFLQALGDDFDYFPRHYRAKIARQNNWLRLWLASLRQDRVLLGAWHDSELVGYVIGGLPRDGRAQLYWLYVAPKFRKAGTGGTLLKAGIEELSRRGAKKIQLVTHKDDKFYAKHGFSDVGLATDHGVEQHVMEIKATVVRKHRLPVRRWVIAAAGVTTVLVLLSYGLGRWHGLNYPITPPILPESHQSSGSLPGRVLSIVSTQHFQPAAVVSIAKQNYGAKAPAKAPGVTKVLFTYQSTYTNGQPITIYARAYIPDNATDAPIMAMAPGTVGIGDECAPSLEQPAVRDWANYESHAMAYASQGFAVVITDYEGMRDPNDIHHYMVGELEGRAVLDSARALERLPQARSVVNPTKVFAVGYSQGGHSALWADKINGSYAPDVHLIGVVGWAPVSDVTETWADITKGANLIWFGPYVLVSYADYYHVDLPLANILLPQWIPNLRSDVLKNCIDTDIPFWGRVPGKVYTSQFLKDLSAGNLDPVVYGPLQKELQDNIAGDAATDSAKLINQGMNDNVVLPQQTQNLATRLCLKSKGTVTIHYYPNTTHYNNMVNSYADTLQWMRQVMSSQPTASSCPGK